MKFSLRISDLRHEKKLTANELGALINLSKFAVSNWENGKAYPGVETCLKLCQIFDCSMDYLLGLSDNRHDDVGLDPTEATLIERLRELPEDHRKAVELFVEFLHVKTKDPS